MDRERFSGVLGERGHRDGLEQEGEHDLPPGIVLEVLLVLLVLLDGPEPHLDSTSDQEEASCIGRERGEGESWNRQEKRGEQEKKKV